jgi:hypothetical protein
MKGSPVRVRASASTYLQEKAIGLASLRRERLEKHDQEGIALVWLAVSDIEGTLRGFDVLEAAGALTVEQRVLQEDLIDLLAGGEAAEVERL